MPAFHVQISDNPIHCRTPLLRRCFALHAALGSVVEDGQVDAAEFACIWSAALGSCLPAELGAPAPKRCNTAEEWVAYGDVVERWAFGRSGRGFDLLEWQAACEVAWNAITENLPVPDTVEDASVPFAESPEPGSGD
jgi:hypothetical protein